MKPIIILFFLALFAVISVSMDSQSALISNNISFEKHVRPIFQKHCSSCHVGSLDYETSYRQRDRIREKVTKREMPPRYRLQLNEQEVEIVKQWLEQGAKE